MSRLHIPLAVVLLGTCATRSFAGGVDSAAWIGEAAEQPAPRFLRFSCPFEGADDPLKVTLSADQRYVLLMDGEVVGRGPAFGDLDHWHSQELELKPGKGPHLLEAVVWKLGHDGFKGDRPSAQLTWRTGFVLKAAGVYDARLTTGVAKWKVGVLKGTVPAGCGAGGEAFGVGCQFEVRGTSVLDESPDRFEDAVVIRPGDAARPSGSGVLAKGWHVRPSLLPEQLHRVIRSGETPAPFRVAAHVRVEKLFDLGNYFCAYPRLTVKGGRGARITWGWTEALRDPAIRDSYSWYQAVGVVRCSKTDRTKREGMAFSEKYAMVDTFVCDGRDSALFTTPWWRCGRWCRITVETADEPLEVVDVSLDETRYPLEDESAFETDDPSLGPIGAMCVRGVQMCAHEIMYDCPFWEQQMYPGDCRVSFLAMTAMTRDDRLIRQGLELFDGARRADGSIPMNWPSNHDQHSVTWTLSWVLSVGDYARWHGDAAWLKARLPGLEHTMLGLGRHENGRGLLEDVPGWSYLDWVAEWRKDLFAPPGATAGQVESAVLNLLYLRGIRATAEALEACGETERAAYWRKKGVRLGGTIREVFWDGRTGRVADTPAKDRFSEHAQALALTCGCLSAEERARALAALEKGGPDMAAASSFGLHFVFEAFTAAGRGDLILGKLDCWRRYVAMNMNCPLESLVFPRSDCHGFGAHPLFHFHSGVAGVTPAAPFFAKVRIAPCPGRLGRIRSKTPHPRGFVEMDLEFNGTAVKGSVHLPVDVIGLFVWRGKEHPLGEGLSEINIRSKESK